MLTPKSAEYMKRKGDSTEQLRNLYGKKNQKTERKRLKQLLYVTATGLEPTELSGCGDCKVMIVKLRFRTCLSKDFLEI